MSLLRVPADYPRIRVVQSFAELVAVPLVGQCNAVCWQRELPGDFDEVLAHLAADAGIHTLDEARLAELPVSPQGRLAIDFMLEDLRLLRAHGLAPNLDCIAGYARDDAAAIVPVDVYSFHIDRATVATDTYLCSYRGPASEGLRNDEAQRRVDVPETRAALLAQFGGQDGEEFREFLRESCCELHYVPLPHTQPFSFGVGNLWRIAVDHPGSRVPACIHRAPATLPGDAPRLLLIS
jgi:hypothetical protein